MRLKEKYTDFQIDIFNLEKIQREQNGQSPDSNENEKINYLDTFRSEKVLGKEEIKCCNIDKVIINENQEYEHIEEIRKSFLLLFLAFLLFFGIIISLFFKFIKKVYLING